MRRFFIKFLSISFFQIIFTLFFSTSIFAASHTVLINEILPNPTGTDTGYEWIELKNISNETIDISNWKIQVAGSVYTTKYVFPTGSIIQPKGLITICEVKVANCDLYADSIQMQNGGSATDGVRIINNIDQVVDTILYDKPNLNNLKNDLGEITPDYQIIDFPNENISISRISTIETDNYLTDFTFMLPLSPKLENIPIDGYPVISEIFPAQNQIEFLLNCPNLSSNWKYKVGDSIYNFGSNLPYPYYITQYNTSTSNCVELLYGSYIYQQICYPNSLPVSSTWCSLQEKGFYTFCEPTPIYPNLLYQPKFQTLQEITSQNPMMHLFSEFCITAQYEDLLLGEDNTGSIAIKATTSIQVNHCYKARISRFDLNYTVENIISTSTLQIISSDLCDLTDNSSKTIKATGTFATFNGRLFFKSCGYYFVISTSTEILNFNEIYEISGVKLSKLLTTQNSLIYIKEIKILSSSKESLAVSGINSNIIFLSISLLIPYLISKLLKN